MTKIAPLVLAALLSTATIAPLVAMELRVNPGHSNFPYALFVFLWLVAAAAVILSAPLVQAVVRHGITVMVRPAALLLRVGLTVGLVWVWFLVVRDQMPCFLGVPNCD